MAARRRIALSLMVIGGGVLVASVLLARLFFDPDRYRPEIISYFEQNTGKQTEIERLALTFSPRVTIHVYGFGVKNPPPFPPGYLVKVAQADAVIDPWAVLHGAVVVRSLVVKDVALNAVSAPGGRWNFQNPQAKSSKNTFPLGIIDRVVIERAQLTVSNMLPSGAISPAFVEGHDITTELTLVNLAAIVNPTSPSLNGHGTCRVGRLRFGVVEATQVNSIVRLESWKVSLADVKASAYNGTVTGNLSLSFVKTNATFTTDARVGGVDLTRLLAAFHEGRAGVTGKLEGDVKLAGEVEHTTNPLASVHGTGHVRVTNGQVPSLMSNWKVRELLAFNDLGPGKANPSSFSSISADLQLANLRVSSKAIVITGYGVDVHGSGRVSVSGSDELNYRGAASITTRQNFLANTFARLGGARLTDGRLSFSFQIEGTIENPVFSKATEAK